ncbi:MAG TPA: ATP-binding protein [Acidimicrobiia bacterium]|nr:ATP-binding protein [Acidimicrobiia bacterium]
MTDYDHTARVTIATSDGAPAGARRFLGSQRASWMDDDMMSDTLLVVSEVVSNAIKHGGVGDAIDLMVRISGDALWVGVTQPRDFAVSMPSESGYGLILVDVLSSRWGTLDWSDGTLVWFEMERKREKS